MKNIIALALTVMIFSVSCTASKATTQESTTLTGKAHTDCNVCHLQHQKDKEGKILLNKPLAELCIFCHPDRKGKGEHVIGIKPSMPVEKLPLDADGKLTCLTCHDPHAEKGFNKLLRAATFTELCKKCHKN